MDSDASTDVEFIQYNDQMNLIETPDVEITGSKPNGIKGNVNDHFQFHQTVPGIATR